MRQSTRPIYGYLLINHAYQRLNHKGHGKISDHNRIHLLRPLLFLVVKLITLSSPLGKSVSIVFQMLAVKPFAAAYAVNCIHQTWKYLFSLLTVGSRTDFVDISMFMFSASWPALGLSRNTFKYVGGTLYLLRITTGQL